MIAVELQCRLGNQMFQLAAGYHLAKKYDRELVLYENRDNKTFEYERIPFILSGRTVIDSVAGFREYKEGKYQERVDLSTVNQYDKVHLKGFFQSDIYFDREDAEELFPIPQYIQEQYAYLKDYVCISVRRGDYLNYKNLFISPSVEWFERCYHKYFEGKKVLICSDDIEWAKKNFNIDAEYLENDDPVETLFIKAMCNNHIISPSTYAWWSAYLAGDDATVIAPVPWIGKYLQGKFNEEDKYVEGWIREHI